MRFDFGDSLIFRSSHVIELIKEKAAGVDRRCGLCHVDSPISCRSLWASAKAVKEAQRFDTGQSAAILIAALCGFPVFLFAILLLVLFAGGSYWGRYSPLRGLTARIKL